MNYEMTQEQLDTIMEACKPTPAMYLSGGEPMAGTPQENANRAWASLGREMGFKPMTVQPIRSKGERFFSADPIPEQKTPITKADNPGVGITGTRVGGDSENELDNYYICQKCFQSVDKRELGQVLHHEMPVHNPITSTA